MKGLTNQQDQSLYDIDFDRWCEETASAIREGRFDGIDREQLADEIQDMAKRDRRELRSRMIVLVKHLLKWQWQPELRQQSTWRATINEQRTQIELLLADSPSLRTLLYDELDTLSRKAWKAASYESRLKISKDELLERFRRPFTIGEILDEEFLPSLDERDKP